MDSSTFFDRNYHCTFLAKCILLFGVCTLVAGCGSPVSDQNDDGKYYFPPEISPTPPDPTKPDIPESPEGPDDPLNPKPTVAPTPKAVEKNASPGVTRETQTEHYDIATQANSGLFTHGLIESSGGSYELEPIL